MYSSNGFNVCPHCGKANSLNARYCSSCGKKLAVPEEVVVCHKCHRTNSPMATFCGSCGAPLRVGAQSKICPKCHREVDINQNVCACGYSFSTIQYAQPDAAPVDVAANPEAPAAPEKKSKKKSGRGIAAFMLILLLVFAYLIVAPMSIRPAFLYNLDKGLVMEATAPGGNEFFKYVYGFDMVYIIYASILGTEGLDFGGTVACYGGVGGYVMACIVLLTALVMVVQLLVYLIRLIAGGRNKKASFIMLIMALLTTLWLIAVIVFANFVDPNAENFLAKMHGWIVPVASEASKIREMGWVIYAIPVYYWFFFFMSLLTKKKVIKEEIGTPAV